MVSVVERSSSIGHYPFKKGKKKKNQKVWSAGDQTKKSKFKSDQSQIECFYYMKQD